MQPRALHRPGKHLPLSSISAPILPFGVQPASKSLCPLLLSLLTSALRLPHDQDTPSSCLSSLSSRKEQGRERFLGLSVVQSLPWGQNPVRLGRPGSCGLGHMGSSSKLGQPGGQLLPWTLRARKTCWGCLWPNFSVWSFAFLRTKDSRGPRMIHLLLPAPMASFQHFFAWNRTRKGGFGVLLPAHCLLPPCPPPKAPVQLGKLRLGQSLSHSAWR
jgi:hypothetical protein